MRILSMMFAGVLVCVSLGCNDQNRMDTMLQALERGKAEGALILSSDGRMSVNQSVEFGIGAGKSSLSFSGSIDFSDKLNREETVKSEE